VQLYKDLDPVPIHYRLKDNESLVFDDVEGANRLSSKYSKVRWDKKKKKWIGEGEEIPRPELRESRLTPERMLTAILRGYLGEIQPQEFTEQQFEKIGRDIKAAEAAGEALEQMRGSSYGRQ